MGIISTLTVKFCMGGDAFAASSVARGAGGHELPIGQKSMQNTTFLVILRTIFAPKLKIAPQMGLAIRSCEGLAVIWTTSFFYLT